MTRALAILTILMLAAPAHADPPALTPPAPQLRRIDHWYGHQTVVVDLLSLGGIAAGLVTESPATSLLGFAGLWLGAPAIHLAHGESDRAVASFLMRPGLVVGGALVGAKLEDCSSGEEWCGLAGGLLGSIIGLGTAVVIDAAWSYEVTVAPIVHPRGESYGLGLAAAF